MSVHYFRSIPCRLALAISADRLDRLVRMVSCSLELLRVPAREAVDPLTSSWIEDSDSQGGRPDAGHLDYVSPFHGSAAKTLNALDRGEAAAPELALRELRAAKVSSR